ncbi:hypothetical protein ACUTQ5_05600 [Serratia sp. NA_112.1]
MPLFDIAYQGFGDGLDEGCFALREALKIGLEFLVANVTATILDVTRTA